MSTIYSNISCLECEQVSEMNTTFGTAAWKTKSVNVVVAKFVKVALIVVSWGFPGCFLKLNVILKVALWNAVIVG